MAARADPLGSPASLQVLKTQNSLVNRENTGVSGIEAGRAVVWIFRMGVRLMILHFFLMYNLKKISDGNLTKHSVREIHRIFFIILKKMF